MYIDINRVLPNGAPIRISSSLTPMAPSGVTSPRAEAESLRFAAGYVKDTTRWGNYSFNVMGGHTETENGNSSLNLSVAQNADHRRWGSTGASLWRHRHRPDPLMATRIPAPDLAPASVRYINPLTNIDKTISPIWSIENDRT
jgi:hypothetical protein